MKYWIIPNRADETNDHNTQEKSIGVMKDSIYHQKAKKQWFKWVNQEKRRIRSFKNKNKADE